MIQILLNERPVPWAAPNRHGNRYFDKRYKDKALFRKLIAEQYKGPLIDCAVILHASFGIQPPKSTTKKMREKMIKGEVHHTVKPDGINICKLGEDCLKGIVLLDDNLVVEHHIHKYWAETDHILLQIIPKL